MLIALNTVSSALQAFKRFTGDPDVQVQAVETFLKIATTRNPSFEDLFKTIGLSRSTISRNLTKLAVGPREQPGYGLITVEPNSCDRRKRVIGLSVRGHELMRYMEDKTMPRLRRYFIEELLLKPY
jgi:DNA-binding MarR family transcriptional regulator